MTRRRLVCVVVVSLVLAVAAHLLLIRPVVRLSAANRARVSEGMAEAEVVGIMGEPDVRGFLQHFVGQPDFRCLAWYADGVEFCVLFDDEGRVFATKEVRSPIVPATAFHRLRAWLGW